jgi:rhamnose utilization protein RhaD (predicted bifunctional aldolase and dehydrogenase)
MSPEEVVAGQTSLAPLAAMSRRLGDPALDYAILGEGTTSEWIDVDAFWVKASGAELRTVEASGFVQVRFEQCCMRR